LLPFVALVLSFVAMVDHNRKTQKPVRASSGRSADLIQGMNREIWCRSKKLTSDPIRKNQLRRNDIISKMNSLGHPIDPHAKKNDAWRAFKKVMVHKFGRAAASPMTATPTTGGGQREEDALAEDAASTFTEELVDGLDEAGDGETADAHVTATDAHTHGETFDPLAGPTAATPAAEDRWANFSQEDSPNFSSFFEIHGASPLVADEKPSARHSFQCAAQVADLQMIGGDELKKMIKYTFECVWSILCQRVPHFKGTALAQLAVGACFVIGAFDELERSRPRELTPRTLILEGDQGVIYVVTGHHHKQSLVSVELGLENGRGDKVPSVSSLAGDLLVVEILQPWLGSFVAGFPELLRQKMLDLMKKGSTSSHGTTAGNSGANSLQEPISTSKSHGSTVGLVQELSGKSYILGLQGD
jgi:hypothetical protein